MPEPSPVRSFVPIKPAEVSFVSQFVPRTKGQHDAAAVFAQVRENQLAKRAKRGARKLIIDQALGRVPRADESEHVALKLEISSSDSDDDHDANLMLESDIDWQIRLDAVLLSKQVEALRSEKQELEEEQELDYDITSHIKLLFEQRIGLEEESKDEIRRVRPYIAPI